MTAALQSGLAPAASRLAAGAEIVDDSYVQRTVMTNDGVRLAVRDYRSQRADDPTVVLLHGLLLAQESWDLQVGQLRRQYGTSIRIITYDHRGHGRSGAAPTIAGAGWAASRRPRIPARADRWCRSGAES
jgi:pimeloyl-ACP methyl ester carboxylesterase